MNREQAEQLVSNLRNALPETLKVSLGRLEVFGLRAHKMRLYIAGGRAREVQAIWKDLLKEAPATAELYVTAEREPAVQHRFAQAGRARAALEDIAATIQPTSSDLHMAPRLHVAIG